MSIHKIHLLDAIHPAGIEILQLADDLDISLPSLAGFDLQSRLSVIDALIVSSSTSVGKAVLDLCPELKIIACAGGRLDSIDLELATRLGILVIYAPETNTRAAAELTFALMLSQARHIPAAATGNSADTWTQASVTGTQLAGKHLGIIGFGRIGQAVAARALAFDMKVLVFDPYIDFSTVQMAGAELVSFDELLESAEIITLHPALTNETNRMLNSKAFARLKPGAWLVNCTHPALVDEQALLSALESGQVRWAAIDTGAGQPPAYSLLLNHPHVLAVPHLSENTQESQLETSRQIAQDLLASLRGEDFRHAANLPFFPTVNYESAVPYIHLAAKMGRLQGQLAGGRITRLEVEVLGSGMHELVRPLTATLLSGMLRPVQGKRPNWVSAPLLAHEQGIQMAQVSGLVQLEDYPNLIACQVHWQGGHLTTAGVLFGNGEARLVQYDRFHVDAYPDGYVLILENDDVPGVIGKVGTRLGQANINIAQWRYGREGLGGKAVSFINLDHPVPLKILKELEQEPEISRARLVRL